ncbi:MAG: tetratricopeptide repeat protein [bacterium]
MRRLISKGILILLLTFTCNLPSALAQFEDLGVGARGIGMGNSFIGLADDGYSIYYNPAGLGRIGWQELVLDYGKLYWGLDDNSNLGQSFVGYAQSLKHMGTLGVGWLNFALTRYYSEDTFMLAYGKRISNSKAGSLSAGLSFKVLHKGFKKTLYTENAVNLDTGDPKGGRDPVFENGYSRTGFSTDLGLLYDLGRHHSFALTLNDINQPDMGLADRDRLALGTKLGYAWRGRTFNMTSDLSSKRRDITFSAGAEKWFMGKTFAVRGGLGIGTREYASLSLGASYRYSRLFQFDYSFVYPLRGISSLYGSHRFSLTLRFGVKVPEEVQVEAELRKTKSELESAKAAAEKARLDAEEIMKAKETSERKIKEAQEKQQQTEEKLRLIEAKLRRVEEKLRRVSGKARVEPEEKAREKLIKKYWSRGFSHYQKGRYEKAIAELERILELDPDYLEAKQLIMQAKEKMERRIEDEVERLYTRGLKAYSEGHLEEAVREWEQALKLAPGNEKIQRALEGAEKELKLKEGKKWH